MSKKVYSLKKATGLMKIVHMRHVMEFQDQLMEHQNLEAERIHAEGMETCQQLRDLMTQEEYNAWWEEAPEVGFFQAARTKLSQLKSETLKHTPYDFTAAINYDQPDPTDAQECADISNWLDDTWDNIPEVEL